MMVLVSARFDPRGLVGAATVSSGMALDSWSSTTEGVKERLEQEYAAVQLELSELGKERARAAAFRAALLPGRQADVDAQCVCRGSAGIRAKPLCMC